MTTTYTIGSLPDSNDGYTKSVLAIMCKFSRQGKTNPVILAAAREAVSHLDNKDFAGEVEAIYDFVRANVRYTLDIDGVETLQTPIKTLELKHGDCDDMSMLAASMLMAIGHPTRFIAVQVDGGEQYTHVFVETKIGPNWVAVDCTEPHDVGWRYPNITGKPIVRNCR